MFKQRHVTAPGLLDIKNVALTCLEVVLASVCMLAIPIYQSESLYFYFITIPLVDCHHSIYVCDNNIKIKIWNICKPCLLYLQKSIAVMQEKKSPSIITRCFSHNNEMFSNDNEIHIIYDGIFARQ